MDQNYEMYLEAYQQPSPFVSFLSFAVSVFILVCMWKIFVKAGEPGWAAIIPFYNTYVLFKITWGSGWKWLLLLIPLVNVVIYILTMIKLAKAFGKSSGYGVGLALLGIVFTPMLAFGDAEYLGVPA